ncbi:hypothetical protein [Gloeothece verrucosa]|uniref:Uncharacterized protein n=1 Tax=Gloeothece verrucosa (strain PCC 7822) TaxID=497965 RepID=E0UNI3_GLOV7|nr:hypothetical protein [Gloeothece verrucosa]ADN18513.1 hypothetical protein Cyan7822_6867 [Gloeothece verrucosa PCC 7822]
MGRNPNHRLDDYEKQFYDEDENLLPEWEYPFVTWGVSKFFYYPDGKPRREYERRVWDSDFDSAGVAHALTGKEDEVKEWRETEEYWQEQFGISYTERIRESERTERAERRKRLGFPE